MALSVYLPGFWSIPPVDRDESRFAQASRQMFEAVALPVEKRDPAMHSGGLVIPMVQGKARLNKPPGIYWLQVASAWVFTGGDPLRDAIWMYRVPSLLAGLVTVLVTWRIGISMFDARAGWLGSALLAVSPVFVWEAHQARADQVMVAATVVGVWGLWKIATERRSDEATEGKTEQQNSRTAEQQIRKGGIGRRWLGGRGLGWAVLMWGAVGVGAMVKGPVTPMVVGLTAVGYGAASRDWRWMRGLRPVLGLVIVAAMVGPWVWAVAERVGFDVYAKTVYDEVIGRSGEAKEGHWGPPGYHLVFMLVLFWPGCMMAGLGVWRAWGRVWRVRRGRKAEQQGSRTAEQQIRRGQGAGGREGRPPLRLGFLLAWLVPSWVVFELVMTKLPHYTMPMYPALALLSARAVFAAEGARRAARLPSVVSILMYGWFVMGALFAVAPVVLYLRTITLAEPILPVLWLALAAALLFMLARRLAAGRLALAQVSSVMLAVLIWSVSLGVLLPGADSLWVSEPIARRLRAIDPGRTRAVASVEFHEDSLIFALRGRVERINVGDVDGWFVQHPTGIVALPLRDFVQRQDSLEGLGTVSGFNYSRGRSVAIELAELKR